MTNELQQLLTELKELRKETQSVMIHQAEMNIVLKSNTRTLEEHQKASSRNGKRLKIVENWLIEHSTTHKSRMGLVKDVSIVTGLCVALARLFGLI